MRRYSADCTLCHVVHAAVYVTYLDIQQVRVRLAQLRVRPVAPAGGGPPEEQQAAALRPGVLPRCTAAGRALVIAHTTRRLKRKALVP